MALLLPDWTKKSSPAVMEVKDKQPPGLRSLSKGMATIVDKRISVEDSVAGEFLDRDGERYYAIHNIDGMAPFFISVVSDSDHWLFISSTGGLTAGRVSPDNALFPYVTVDKIHDSANHTGSKTLMRVQHAGGTDEWEPFNIEHDGRFHIGRHLYKNLLGNKLCFEEINHDLKLAFRYTWMSSDRFGFVRDCELENYAEETVQIDLVDGLQNILPAGTPRQLQAQSSNLVDAYKWNELNEESGLAYFTLYSGITDRPQPYESLRANTVFCLGLDHCRILLSTRQLENFRLGESVQQEAHTRGNRGAFLVNTRMKLKAGTCHGWQLVAGLNQTQAQVVDLRRRLMGAEDVGRSIKESVAAGSEHLQSLMAGVDGLQLTAEENVTAHHYANVLFNSMRGGIFDDQYSVSRRDITATVRHFNRNVYQRNQAMFEDLPDRLPYWELMTRVEELSDPRLESLCREYLPITFGRRHGDPSRPWNDFAIRLKDEDGNRLLSYQGNWRDIFQNWEALSLSYPEFIESVIAKFVNASTVDGYNPYRITKEGIDWEVEDPDDPWSYIGYWGDHQIIYLLKLLELSIGYHPKRLAMLLYRPVFCYANVPYRIKSFADLRVDPKDTVVFSGQLDDEIQRRVSRIGEDGKLLLDGEGDVYHVNLLEKLLVPLLSKLGNLVLDGGIWMNTQRPEWNDANNALVGQGLSMVTLYYLRRYIAFLNQLLSTEKGNVTLSQEIHQWHVETAQVLKEATHLVAQGPVSDTQRLDMLRKIGEAAGRYRETIYQRACFSARVSMQVTSVRELLDDALTVVDHSISSNRKQDGLYHAYNLIQQYPDRVGVDHLYLMLEGQVAALSSTALNTQQAIVLLEGLFRSGLYRPDQHSFMLYPDRPLPGFLDKNVVSEADFSALPVLRQMLARGDESVLLRDSDGCYRFNADLINRDELESCIDELVQVYGDDLSRDRQALFHLYEKVFDHQAFTGRSGGMFSFEGIGCIYWHMVSKLLLAAQEVFFSALDDSADHQAVRAIGELYYRVRDGIGFNKTPLEYGAFPTDPYSHTPKHSGARQPGMTGQVKEEILTRFGELGIRVRDGVVCFQPQLLRPSEFVGSQQSFRYLDVSGKWQELTVPVHGLAFTWCQIPLIYELNENSAPQLTIHWADGQKELLPGMQLSEDISREVFMRSGRIRQLSVKLDKVQLFAS